MRQAGRVVADAKAEVLKAISPGVSTRELDRIAERVIRDLGGVSSFKGYKPGFAGNQEYPATICSSVNDQIVHGIPGNQVLRQGDLISVDVGAIVGGLHGDSAFSVGVGKVSSEVQKLIDTTRECLERGIVEAKVGARIGKISRAVQNHAESNGFSLVRHYGGHGIGYEMHEEPWIPNFGEPNRGPTLRRGMAICIEPMLNVGGWETRVLDDGWTVVTADGSLSAHFEETIAITDEGPEVTTALTGAHEGD